MKILLIEDSKICQRALTSFLSNLGHSFDIAEDGLSGIRRCRNDHYDVILSDYGLPDICGVEVVGAIRAYEKHAHLSRTPVICISAVADQYDMGDVGFDEVQMKPTRELELKKILDRYSPKKLSSASRIN